MTTAERRCTCGHRGTYHQLAADPHWRRCTVCDCPDFTPAPLHVPAQTT